MHTDSIITKNNKTAKQFLKNVKSSIAMHNTSTQFADGGEFGFGGTWFSPKVSKLDARKKWIISSIAPRGAIIIDDGAKKALKSGKSLLAAGIKKVSGKFNKGDHIKILDKKNNEYARGLSSFTSDV